MAKEVSIRVAGREIVLNADRGLFLSVDGTLIVSDLHLGKATHFQKHGLAIPGEVAKKDLNRLENLILHYHPSKAIIAGDLFHAAHNSEWDLFLRWLKKWPETSFHLVKGNHDRLNESFYTQAGLTVHPDQYNLMEGRVVHIPTAVTDDELEISGHIHPGIQLKGRGRQRLRVPCFVVRKNQIILPAFSHFTGLDTGFTHHEDEIYAIVEDEIIQLS